MYILHITSLYISQGGDREILLNNQDLVYLKFISSILLNLMFYSDVTVTGCFTNSSFANIAGRFANM